MVSKVRNLLRVSSRTLAQIADAVAQEEHSDPSRILNQVLMALQSLKIGREVGKSGGGMYYLAA